MACVLLFVFGRFSINLQYICILLNRFTYFIEVSKLNLSEVALLEGKRTFVHICISAQALIKEVKCAYTKKC